MTIALTGTGGLFTRLQKITDAHNTVIRLLRTGSLTTPAGVTLGTAADNINAQFASARQDLVTGLYAARDGYRAVHASWLSYLKTLAANVVIEMANDDATLSNKTLLAAMTELRAQMLNTSDSVLRPTVSVSVAVGGSNTGNGKLAATHLGADGLALVFQFAESVRATCTSDSYTGGATAGKEQFSLRGAVAQTDPNAYDWPKGSGASASLTAIDAEESSSTTGQLLQNGGFETFTTSNVPDNWVIGTGSAGTSVLSASGGNVYSGSAGGLAIVGDGAELTKVTQTFGVTPTTTVGAGGTSQTLKPSTVYALNYFVKMSATPSGGVLAVSLTDSGGTILQVNSTDQTVSKDLTTVSTSFVAVNGFVRTPAALTGTSYKIQVKLSTALQSAKTAYIDHLALTPATQLYAGGPYVALFSGNTDFLKDDSFTLTVANDYAGKWLLHLDRLLGLRALGVIPPHVASAQTITEPTITAF